jgi:N-ethylmaleimide reductase
MPIYIGNSNDLVAFGRPFINNPDLVARLKNNWLLSQDLQLDLFYSEDAKGYADYPNHAIL